MNRSLLRLVIPAGLRILEVFAGQDDLAAHQQGTAVAIRVAFKPERDRAGGERARRGGRIVHHANFECCRTAKDILGLGDILYARQLHDDPVVALLLDDGLGHAKLVDPVVQRGDVLLERAGLDCRHCGSAERADQLKLAAVRALCKLQIRIAPAQRRKGFFTRGFRWETGDHRHPLPLDAADFDPLVAQGVAQVGHHGIVARGERALHIDLEQEVHAAAQIQTEVHRMGPDRRQPSW